MPLRLRPEVIDNDGFHRRAWEFDCRGHVYHIQETAGPYHVLKQAADDHWLIVNENEMQKVVAAFEQERGPDLTGFR